MTSNSGRSRGRKEKENKKAFRKLTNDYLCALDQFCRRAQNSDNVLENLKPFSKFSKNDLKLDITYRKAESFDETTSEEIFSVFEQNMRDMYEKSAVGWIKREKWDELFDNDARYVLARDDANMLHGG